MKKFDLWFPKPPTTGFDEEAETSFCGKVAYICIVQPFDNGTGQHTSVNPKGRILINHESVSAEECCAQIDALIEDLKSLKLKANREFKKSNCATALFPRRVDTRIGLF